jgi:putative copper export protein
MVWITVLWVHLIAAMVWIGGMAFLTIIAAPSLKRSAPPEVQPILYKDIGRRFKLVGWICIFILILTGPINIYHHITSHHMIDDGEDSFHGVFVLKLGLVLIMILLSLIHDFVLGPLLGEKIREGVPPSGFLKLIVPWMGRVNLILGLIVIYLGLTLAQMNAH